MNVLWDESVRETVCLPEAQCDLPKAVNAIAQKIPLATELSSRRIEYLTAHPLTAPIAQVTVGTLTA